MRAPAPGRRERRRADPEPGRLDALLLGDPRRARGGRPAGGRGAPLGRRRARGVAPHLRDPRPLHRLRAGQGRRGLPRGARAAEGAAPRERRARRPAASSCSRERELDSLLVTNLVNVRYLTGFTGTNGACVVTPEERLFFTDFRYVEQAREQVPDFERLRGGPRHARATWRSACAGAPGSTTTHLSVRRARASSPRRCRTGWSWCRPAGSSSGCARVKDEAEVAAMRGGRRARDGGVRRRSASAGWPGGPSARWPSDSSASWRTRAPRGRRSRRSSRPAPTARCRTRCRATSRSRATRSW